MNKATERSKAGQSPKGMKKELHPIIKVYLLSFSIGVIITSLKSVMDERGSY
jgi:hypothetical protein